MSTGYQPVTLPAARAGELLTLRRAAFARVAAQEADAGHWAIAEELAEVERELEAPSSMHVGLQVGERLVAAVRLRFAGDVARLDRLVVAPDVQQQGVGLQLVREIPGMLPEGIAQVEVDSEASEDHLEELVGAYLRHLG